MEPTVITICIDGCRSEASEAKACGSHKVLQRTVLPGCGDWADCVLCHHPTVLPGGGLRPPQQPGGGPAAVGGREAQDAATPGQAAEADGGRLPVAEAGGESPGEEKAQPGEGEDMPQHLCWTPPFLK